MIQSGCLTVVFCLYLIDYDRIVDMAQNQLLEKVRKIPPAYQQEVEDFIDFILTKKRVSNEEKEMPRKIGVLKGKLQMADDFDAPLDDFKDYM